MNQTHASTADAEARLFRQGKSKEAKLGFIGQVLMENRHGLIITPRLTAATGAPAQDMAEPLVGDFPGRSTLPWAVINFMILGSLSNLCVS